MAQYGAIVVDLPAIPARSEDRLNGAAVAAACDTVLLVALSGAVTQTELQESVDAMKAANVPLEGIVLNDRYSPTLGSEFAREARRLSRYAPRLSQWLQRKALSNPFLN